MYVLCLCYSDLSTIIAIIQSLYFTHKRVMIYFDIDINLYTIYIGIQLAITIKYSVFMGAKHMEQLHFCRAISVFICLNM